MIHNFKKYGFVIYVNIYVYACMCACVLVLSKDQKRMLDSLSLALQTIVSCLWTVLATELWSWCRRVLLSLVE